MEKIAIIKSRDSNLWRDSHYHKQFGLKSGEAVKRLLSVFEKECPNDDRPRKAVEAIIAWAKGKRKLGMSEVRKLSLDSHAAAKKAKSDVAKYVAHAAGQAVATWHVPTHALGAFAYIGKAIIVKKKK